MSQRQPSAPPEIPGLKYVDLVGMGGFADVFRYEQLGLNRKVAVKVLLRDLGEASQRSFEAEANLMAKLSTHPSIVSVYSAGQAPDGRPYLVMEYCPPPHLSKRIASAPLSVAKTLEIGIQIAAAVEMAHRNEVLHRDIKPANILFTEYGRPALTDFGISVTTESASRGQGVGMSVPWAPPEQLTSGQQMGPASDVYSLAATLWTALKQRSPFELPQGPNDAYTLSKRVRTEPLPALDHPGAPPSLELVLKTALAKQPTLRYSSALEFARALQNVQAELHLSVTPIDILQSEQTDYELSRPIDTGTQVVNPISIDPEGPSTHQLYQSSLTEGPRFPSQPGPSGQFISHGRGSASEARTHEFTRLPQPQLETIAVPEAVGADPVAAPVPAPKAKRGGLVAGIVIGAVLVGGGTFWGVNALRDGPAASRPESSESSSTAQPHDPVGQNVPMPNNLVLTVEGDQVLVTWDNPSPEPGDSYLWTLLDPSQPEIAQPTDEQSVTVPALPGRTCVQVQLVRANGRYSDPLKGCTP